MQDDVLAFCRTASCSTFDAILSTYTLHHLDEPEKLIFFTEARRILHPENGKLIIGDLMFENPTQREQILQAYRANGQQHLAEEIEDEFFWDLDSARAALETLGFSVETRVFSQLSWGILVGL